MTNSPMTASPTSLPNQEQIRRAAELIQAGGLVGFPTETVYGLGADALNVEAVTKIFHIKKRPAFNPLIVHVAEMETFWSLVSLEESDHQIVEDLTRRFWPGPLTLVLPRRRLVPNVVTAGLPTVGIRMPAHPVALALIREAGTPIAAPSANPFGFISPTQAQHVLGGLGGQIDCILDGGPALVGVESTILWLVDGQARLLRPGSVSREDLEAVIGPVGNRDHDQKELTAPGQMLRHYGTRTPLFLLPARGERPSVPPGKRIGLLTCSAPKHSVGLSVIEVLSHTGDLNEAARNLFAALHRLDGLGLDYIWAEPCPEFGMGAAIMDRLRRCATHEQASSQTAIATIAQDIQNR